MTIIASVVVMMYIIYTTEMRKMKHTIPICITIQCN